MICPNCGSSRIRKAKRNTAEKIFLPIIMTRPFRCEDCIGRFFGWLWGSAPNLNASDTDAKSLVYRSSTAALHSAVHRSRGYRRKAYAKGLDRAQGSLPTSIVTYWLNKPIQQPKQQISVQKSTLPPREEPKRKPQFLPEVLGVILEMKHEPS